MCVEFVCVCEGDEETFITALVWKWHEHALNQSELQIAFIYTLLSVLLHSSLGNPSRQLFGGITLVKIEQAEKRREN